MCALSSCASLKCLLINCTTIGKPLVNPTEWIAGRPELAATVDISKIILYGVVTFHLIKAEVDVCRP